MPADTLVYGLVIFGLLVLLAWAAIEDFRTFRIPNFISLTLLTLYPFAVIFSPQPLPWLVAAAAAAVVLVLGFALFAAGVFGAGDAKLLAVTVLWVGPQDFLPYLVVMTGVTILLIPAVALRAAWQIERENEASGGARAIGALSMMRFVPIRKLTIPYGVAIAAGGGVVAVMRLSATLAL